VLRNVLLTIHLFAVILWLGGGAYELYVARQAKRYRGTPVELPLLRMVATTGPVVAVSMLLVAVTGVPMSWLLGWGFFTVFWLGAVQAIMAVGLGIMFSILRPYYRAGELMRALPPGPGEATDEIRAMLAALDPWILAMRIGALVAAVLAIWKPSF
jgi:hypothetical protein